MGPGYVTAAYRAGQALARALPRPVADAVASQLAGVSARVSKERRLLVERNLRRILGDDVADSEIDRLVVQTIASYARYWVDSFRLPTMTAQAIDDGMDFSGVEHINRAVDRGIGPIMVLPHLGGWEWAGFWLSLVAGFEVTAVVEPLEPPDLFEFFTAFREELGMHVVPLGPEAGPAVLRGIKQAHVLCLLADRDIEGNGVEVTFFGERTTLPAGPATLALRTGAPLLPTACYSRATGGIHTVVLPPIPVERREGRLRADVVRITQDVAYVLEELIGAAPDQWHMQQPNWPSDYDALEAIGKPHPRPGAAIT